MIKRGDIFIVNLEPVKGSEQGKTRPCLVIQNDVGNRSGPTTIIATITSNTKHNYPFTVFIRKGEANLPHDSLVTLNQIKTISVSHRIVRKLGSLKPETMRKVDEAIKVSLGLD